MPGKTNTELIRDLITTVAALAERMDYLRREIDRLEKAREEMDRKIWSLTMALVAALLSLIGAMVVLIVRK